MLRRGMQLGVAEWLLIAFSKSGPVVDQPVRPRDALSVAIFAAGRSRCCPLRDA